MDNLLRVIADELRTLLNAWLPQLSADWWERYVLGALTYQQQERVKQARINELSGLDLAALLRVVDQNWFELSSLLNWPKEGRNWLKEAQTIRNRWAHTTAAETDPDDAYRDADTLERLAKLLGVCPNHAAMYKNGGLTPDTVRRAVLECERQKISLNLAGNQVELYFIQQHLGDLRAVLTTLNPDEIWKELVCPPSASSTESWLPCSTRTMSVTICRISMCVIPA